MNEFKMHGDYIQIDQLFKKYDLIQSGGQIRGFLDEHEVLLNGQRVTEKRKKIHEGDELSIDGTVYKVTGE